MDDKAHKAVSPVYLERAIRGNLSSLMIAFPWHETRQGFNHWSDIYNGQKEMSQEDTEYMKSLLERHYSCPRK